jgi:hypothetical protein
MRSSEVSFSIRGIPATVRPTADASVRTGFEGVLLSTKMPAAAFSLSTVEHRSRTRPTLRPPPLTEMIVWLVWLLRRLDSTKHGVGFVIIGTV